MAGLDGWWIRTLCIAAGRSSPGAAMIRVSSPEVGVPPQKTRRNAPYCPRSQAGSSTASRQETSRPAVVPRSMKAANTRM